MAAIAVRTSSRLGGMSMKLNRRQFTGALAATLAVPALPMPAMEVRGVQLGLQTFTFHQVRMGGLEAVNEMITAMQELKVNLCELWAPQVEPFALPGGYWSRWQAHPEPGVPAKPTPEESAVRRAAIRAWRTNPPADFFPQIKKRFDQAGVRVFAYNYSFEPTMTDAEIDHGFLAAKALGLNLVTASSRVSDAKRVAPFATKHNMPVAFHGHADLKDPDQVTTPESFRAVLSFSPLYRINLDVAHFASAGFDAVAFLKEHHEHITNIHVHDRKANDGASVPYGEGVAPTRAVLQLLRDNKWKIPAFYELEYVGAEGRGVVAETRRELDYEISVLNS
jgi:sugar phosphate isomerase/epimerase